MNIFTKKHCLRLFVVGARVMLRRNIDVSSGLVNGAVGTVIAIKAHHITVQFDGRPEPHNVERVRSKFMFLKKVYVHRKQFPLILAFAVTVHKCHGLSLDCAIMDLSEQVFCPGMAYVALSRVKQLDNLHLIAFHEDAIKVSSKCLQEINRLRQTYCPDLPRYTVPRQCTTQTRKRKLAGSLSTTTTTDHHITVQFDGRPEPHNVERVRSKFMLLKKVYVHCKQFPLILALAVTVHKCQGLSLDCATMDLSEQVFCPRMAYVALSPVKQLENLHLIAFHEEAIKVSSKCLKEINCLRQTYRPDLPQYTVPQDTITPSKG